MKAFTSVMKVGGALLIAAPAIGLAATPAARAPGADASDYAPVKRMVIIHLSLSREGTATPLTTMDLAGVDGRTIVRTRHEQVSDDVAICQTAHVSDGECPAQTDMQVADDRTMKVVATPRVQSDGHILVDLDVQNNHANNVAVGELADRLGNVALKETVALQPGVAVTAAAGKGWSVTASAKVLDLTDASQNAASASNAAASKTATE
ncbi:hypothetical protein A8H39_01090 [Paraburkholderia fungorum]|uniref:hypothetical protein n=1 Tax=Paraburkholderia fungorum TaxID=134537 RepID=UPI00048684E9|nr:hypothetical protein [Paraburkholderia fungorum]PNE59774.1 hypothetical protein A8H39_01090 [Paraburkholderia fungorum]